VAGGLAREWGSEAGGPSRHPAPTPGLRTDRVLERDEDVPNFDALPRPNVNARHASGKRGRNLDGSLVGLDLEQRRVLGEDVALVDEHLDDLGLGEPLAQIRKRERSGHPATSSSPVQNARVSRTAATTRGTSGTFAFSRAKPTNGTSCAVTRRMGASSDRKAPSMIEAAISAPGPKLFGAS